jgi:serine/threonine-protein kinase
MNNDLIMAGLDRVTSSQAFRLANRQRSFLRYIVTEALRGRTERLKEYVIGIEVFGKSPSFDPRLDSIVRTEAHKLRAKLGKYFETEGKGDAIRIALPRGKYVPAFFDAAALPAVHAPTPGLREAKGLRVLVLPFESRGTSRSSESFSDCLTDELIHALAAVPGFDVVARSSAFQFKGRTVDGCELARQLKAQAVIEGSVRKTGDRYRILVQLYDPSNGSTLWSQSYDPKVTKDPGVQQEIAQTIACQLMRQVYYRETHGTTTLLAGGAALEGNLEAHDYYFQGMRYFARHTPEDMAEASRLFNLAVEKDVTFTRAYTHLAYSYLMRPVLQAVLPAELVSRAYEAANKALEIDPFTGGAHIVLALQRLQNYQWREAGEEFRNGLRLSRSDALGHAWYGIYLTSVGNLTEAVKEHERALELDEDAAMSSWSYGLTLFLARRYREAGCYFRRTVARYPSFSPAHIGLGMIAVQERNYATAIADLERAQARTAGLGRERAKLGYAYALAGSKDRAREILNELLSSRSAVPAQMVAEMYIGLGDKDNAFKWLHTVIEQKDTPPMLKCDPMFDPLREDSRFATLLQQANMA